MPTISAERTEHDALWRVEENQLMLANLKKIEGFTRRQLMRFLEKESTKDNTKKLRKSARLLVIQGPGIDVDRDLARILSG